MKKTEDMFRKHLEFRKEFPEDYFLNEYKPPKILVDHLLPPVLGYDKDGCPIRLVHVGHQDIKGILCCVRRPEIRKCITWFLDTDKEEMRKRSRETGVHVEKRTFIFDLDGLSLKQIYRREAPSFFYYLFSMIKTLLSDDTVDKLKIYGYNGWKEDLLEHIDADILPVIYGGTRTDPDGNPNCPSLVRIFSPVPQEYYLKNLNCLSTDDENVRKVTVGRRSKCSIHLKVDVPGSTVGWEVECMKNDIKMYLVYAEGPSPETVVKPINISSDFGSEIGCYLAERTGKYSLVLDNSYSIFRNKQVMYRAYVTACTSKNSDVLKTVISEKENC
ncbi:unnamed protein product [Larinioides sclopetarius]|uniref:CRAL-TRIO domain-containing protein n=1 Tax=Larinioides sclopetarius TaxID=280406 RepID=A0AAV2A087_9ARAC